jgi:hypothetical protein
MAVWVVPADAEARTAVWEAWLPTERLDRTVAAQMRAPILLVGAAALGA